MGEEVEGAAHNRMSRMESISLRDELRQKHLMVASTKGRRGCKVGQCLGLVDKVDAVDIEQRRRRALHAA